MYWVIIDHILRLGTISVWALKYTCLLCICFIVGQLNNRTWLFTFSKWKQQTYHPETNIHNIYPVADNTLIESHIKMYKSDFVSITQVLVYTWYEILTDESRIKQKLDKFTPHCKLKMGNKSKKGIKIRIVQSTRTQHFKKQTHRYTPQIQSTTLYLNCT